MELTRFDQFVRSLNGATPRRNLLRGVAGAALAVVLPPGAASAGTTRCKKLCGVCRRCKRGACKPTAEGQPCRSGASCQSGRCRCNVGTTTIDGRCASPCGFNCAVVNGQCARTFDTGTEFCAGDSGQSCSNQLPCANHDGCSTSELCTATTCPPINGVSNKCRPLSAA